MHSSNSDLHPQLHHRNSVHQMELHSPNIARSSSNPVNTHPHQLQRANSGKRTSRPPPPPPKRDPGTKITSKPPLSAPPFKINSNVFPSKPSDSNSDSLPRPQYFPYNGQERTVASPRVKPLEPAVHQESPAPYPGMVATPFLLPSLTNDEPAAVMDDVLPPPPPEFLTDAVDKMSLTTTADTLSNDFPPPSL